MKKRSDGDTEVPEKKKTVKPPKSASATKTPKKAPTVKRSATKKNLAPKLHPLLPGPRGEISRLLAGEHQDPHSILGAHPATVAGEAGVIVRALIPNADAGRMLLDDGRVVQMEREAEGLVDALRRVHSRRDAPAGVSLSLLLRRRRRVGSRRSLSLSADARRRRPASVQRRHAPRAVEEARRASAHDRRRARRRASPCGRRTRGASAWSATSAPGMDAFSRCA